MTDTLYFSVDNDTINLLRFYSNGIVLGVSIAKKPVNHLDEVLSWFNIEKYYSGWSKGTYVFDGTNMHFDLKSSSGVVVYNGHIQGDKSLKLNVHSHINGHKSTRVFKKYTNNVEITINSSVTKQSSHQLPSENYNVKPRIDTQSNKTSSSETRAGISSLENQNSKSSTTTSNGNNFWTYIVMIVLLTGCFTCVSRQREGCHCWDGTNSSATGSGACSHHGGVMYWKYDYWWDK